MNTPTPETYKRIGIINNGSNVVDASWARQLEQERDEARTRGDTYGQKYAACILEREKLKAELKQMSMCLDASNDARAMLGNERDQLRKVADELAELLREKNRDARTESEALPSIFALKDYNSLPHVIAGKKGKAE